MSFALRSEIFAGYYENFALVQILISIYIYIYNLIFFSPIILFSQKKKKKNRTGVKFFPAPPNFAAPFCFDHNFFIRTSFLVILVPLEILKSVEYEYIQKEHF